MELTVGNTYSTPEMMDFFQVSKDKWKREKDNLLGHFSKYYEYEVIYDENDRRKRNYTIVRKIADYEEYKNRRKVIKEKQDKVFETNIMEVIENDNLQTAMNISRIIEPNIKAEFDYSQGTIYEYTRLRVVEWFAKGHGMCGTKGMITEKIWCHLDEDHNCYIPLTDEQIKKFYSIFSENKREVETRELELFSDYQNRLITKEELIEAVGSMGYMAFVDSQKQYKEKYGFRPIKVPKYEIGVFTDNAFGVPQPLIVKEGTFSWEENTKAI